MQGIVEILIELGATFGAGFYVAISPCLFPLLPLFLMRALQSENSRTRSVIVTSALILGILSSLALFAVVSVFIGLFLIQYHTVLQALLGAFIIFFGLLTMSETLQRTLRMSSLNLRTPPTEATGLAGVFLIGMSYSLMAAPCAAPLLFELFFVFSTQTNAIVLLFMFAAASIGVTIPYLVIALTTGEARSRMATRMTENARKLEIAIGALFVLIGLVLILPLFGISIL
ncbi:MAG: cytochrome c biogenesis CcdA family protein [Candidatus Thorarchaeota archaeon]|jgi:cytochrome c biogenesis protein CcdA